MCTVSGVRHSLADDIQCIVDRHEWCLVPRRSGGQIFDNQTACKASPCFKQIVESRTLLQVTLSVLAGIHLE